MTRKTDDTANSTEDMIYALTFYVLIFTIAMTIIAVASFLREKFPFYIDFGYSLIIIIVITILSFFVYRRFYKINRNIKNRKSLSSPFQKK